MEKRISTIIFLFAAIIAYSQPIESTEVLNPRYNDIELPQNPEVAAFGKYGLYDTNLFTGSPQISIPIFNHQGKEMSLPISLTYDASGIKVEQTATNVGLGWNLQYGGVITREINHLPDDLFFDYGSSQFGGAFYNRIYSLEARNIINKIHDLTISKLHWDYMDYLPPGSTLAQADVLAREIWDFYKNIYVYDLMDIEPDVFRFNVNGMSDVILMDYETPIGSSYKAYAKDNPNFKISAIYELGEPGHNTKYINRWVITDENGFKYYFDRQIFRHYQIEKDYPHNNGTIDRLYERKYVEAWYLTKIESPNSYDIYEFIYSAGEVLNEDYLIDTKNEMAVSTYYFSTVYGNNNYVLKKPVISHTNTSIQIHLNEIKYNNKTIFSTEVATRQDKPSSKRYARLNIHNSKGQITQKIDLQQSYFKSYEFQPSDNIYNSRLKLDGLSFYDTNLSEAKKYAFTYYNPYQLPEINSTGMDYWGYYNGRDSNPSLIVDSQGGAPYGTGNRTPDFSYALNGTLKSIFFPTGGRTSFYYEPHVIGAPTNQQFIGGIRLRKQISFTLDEGLQSSEEKYYIYKDLIGLGGNPIQNQSNLPKFNLYSSSGKNQQPLNFEKASTVFHCTSGGIEPRSISKHQFSRNLAQKAPHNITYGEVSEVIFNNGTYSGHTYYKFENEYYNLSGDMATSGPYTELFPDTGKILEKTVYGVKNNNYTPLEKIEYTYQTMHNEEYSHLTKGVTVYGMDTFFANVVIGLKNATPFRKGSIILEECYNVVNGDGTMNWALYNSIFSGGNIEPLTYNYPNEIMHFKHYKHFSFFSKIASEEHTSYFDNYEVTNNIEYRYDSRPFHYNPTEIVNSFYEGNQLIEYTTKYDYPHDLVNNNPPEIDQNHLQDLININNVGSPIKINTYKNQNILSTQRLFYEDGKLKRVSAAKGGSNLEEKFTIHLRDGKGNPVITSVGQGLQNYYIWGYNGDYLLGKISPIPNPYTSGNGIQTIFNSSVISLINTIVDQSNQINPNNQLIKDKFKDLADALPNSFVNGYITSPGEGIISTIDPKHDILNFEYDDQKRLKKTINKENELLAENEYHYRELIINDDDVPDPPPPFSFSIDVGDFIDNTYILTANNNNGSNNGFSFNWSLVDASNTITGSNTQYQNQYLIEYECPGYYYFSSNIVVRCDITNNNTGMSITLFSNQLYSCPENFSADPIEPLVVEELREFVGGQSVFQGLKLSVINLQGGTPGGVEFRWYYKLNDGDYEFIPHQETSNGNESIDDYNYLYVDALSTTALDEICGHLGTIKFKCVISDSLSSIEDYVAETNYMNINCSGNPH